MIVRSHDRSFDVQINPSLCAHDVIRLYFELDRLQRGFIEQSHGCCEYIWRKGNIDCVSCKRVSRKSVRVVEQGLVGLSLGKGTRGDNRREGKYGGEIRRRKERDC